MLEEYGEVTIVQCMEFYFYTDRLKMTVLFYAKYGVVERYRCVACLNGLPTLDFDGGAAWWECECEVAIVTIVEPPADLAVTTGIAGGLRRF